MRRRFLAEIAPGGTWPENPGTAAGAGTPAVDPYSWIRWENRGLADVVMSIDGAIEAPGGTPNPRQYWDYIPAGECNVRNIGKPSATELHLRNVDASATALVWIELDTEPIVDLGNTRILLDRSRKGISSTNPLGGNIAQIGGTNVPSANPAGAMPVDIKGAAGGGLGQAATNQDDGPAGFSLLVAALPRLTKPELGQYERQRTPGTFKPVKAVAVVAGTPVAIWTPAAGKKFRLLGWALSLSVAGSVILEDASGPANEFMRTPLMAAGAGISSPAMGNGFLSASINNGLFADVSASGSISGYVFGNEE